MPPESGAQPKGHVTLPTGTVTFLFSDIEGSTQLWESHRAAMDDAVKRHDALLRETAEQHNGYVFKTVGDAFCVAFARVTDAVTTAINAQRVLNAEDFSAVGGLRVRMGLHAGEASERNADYFGPAVNRVARLMSIGHGGQILLSGVTRDLAHGDFPTGVSLVDLGSHRLKDLSEPEQVWQLTIDGLPADFPPLKSLDTLPNNLPIQVTSFRGREHDLDEVKALLGEHKLLTLFGSGGVGKTRLALQVGAEVLDQYSDGVWLADLAPITDQELVSSIVAKELGMTQVEGRKVDEALPKWLKRKRLLLILDNCEHLIEPVAGLTAAILAAATNVRILATSRQALGIGGEVIYRIPSLAVPEATAGLTAESGSAYSAIALFVDRARASDTAFLLTDDAAPIVAEICRHLDGIPLAIELAAARVKVLSIPHLAQRLNDRFKILTGGSRVALPRQKTLIALIDWSYDLLAAEEQTLFNRVGIFAGGFSLDAATAVCGGEGLDEFQVFNLLSSLTDKSLVVADTTGEQERYRLLESTRAYALEKLKLAGEHEALARRRGEYFRDQAQEADKHYGTGSTAAWLTIVELELDNYRATLEWALTDGHDLALGGAMAGSLERLWLDGGLVVEGRYWVGRVQAGLDEFAHPTVAARLWRALARLSDGKHKRDCAERAVALYQSVGDGHGAARALLEFAWGLFLMGRLEESSDANDRAIPALRSYGDRWGVATGLNRQATIRWYRGDVVAGRELYAQALAGFKALGDEDGTARMLGNLAELEFADGHVEQALSLADEALKLDIYVRSKNAPSLALTYVNTAAYRIAQGDVNGAREAARDGLRSARQAQNTLTIAIALQHFALIGGLRGQVQPAAQIIGYVDVQYKQLESQRAYTERWGYEKIMAIVRDQLGEAEIEKLAAEGAAWSEDQAVEEALKV